MQRISFVCYVCNIYIYRYMQYVFTFAAYLNLMYVILYYIYAIIHVPVYTQFKGFMIHASLYSQLKSDW